MTTKIGCHFVDYVVTVTVYIMKMPGLPKLPAAERIDMDNTGKISGLF